MSFKGSFTFKKDSPTEIELDENLKLKFVRLTAGIARLFCVDKRTNTEVNLPSELSVDDITNQEAVDSIHNSFMLAWADAYDVKYKGISVAKVFNQRQWAVFIPQARQVL